MIFARRLAIRDDQGDTTEDFEAVRVPRAAKRAKPADDATPAYRRRMLKLRAIRVLRDEGFTVAEMAIVLELSERHVGRCSDTIRSLEAQYAGRI